MARINLLKIKLNKSPKNQTNQALFPGPGLKKNKLNKLSTKAEFIARHQFQGQKPLLTYVMKSLLLVLFQAHKGFLHQS